MTVTKAWGVDLARVRSGELLFSVFAQRHDRTITEWSRRWGVRTVTAVVFGHEDAKQEALIAMDRAIWTWDPGRKNAKSIGQHVLCRSRWHLLTMQKAYMRRDREIEADYLKRGGVEDGFAWDGESSYEAIAPGFTQDVYVGGMRGFHRIVGQFDAEGANVVLQFADGLSPDEIRLSMFPERSKWSGLQRVYRVLRRAEEMASSL